MAQYYKGFWSLLGFLAAAPPITVAVIVPFISDSAPAYGFPPMGDIESLARLGLVVFAVLITFLVYYVRGGKRSLFGVALVSFLSLCVYLALYSHFVLRIDIPSQKTTVHVSVGYERTAFAKATFGSDSGEDMLRARGTDDEEIKKLWTYQSLTVARLALFVSYCGFILGLVAVFSLGVALTGSKD